MFIFILFSLVKITLVRSDLRRALEIRAVEAFIFHVRCAHYKRCVCEKVDVVAEVSCDDCVTTCERLYCKNYGISTYLDTGNRRARQISELAGRMRSKTPCFDV